MQPSILDRPMLKFVVAVLVAALAYLVWGYSFGILTNEYHVTIVLRSIGESPFNGDFLANTLEGYASPLWWLVSRLAEWFPVKPIFLTGFLVGRFLFAWAMGRLASAWTVDPSKKGGAWCMGALSTLAIGWLMPMPVGGDPVLGPYCSQTFLSVAILLLAIANAVDGKLVRSSLLLGVATNLNIMQSLLASGVIVGLWIVRAWKEGAVGRRKVVVAGLWGFLASLPAWYFVARSLSSPLACDPMTGQELSHWARFWLEGHFFADGRNAFHLVAMAACLSLPGILVLLRRSPEGWRDSLALSVPAYLAFLQMAVVGQFPSRLLFQTHLFRSDVFAYSVAVALCIAIAVESRWIGGRRLGLACGILVLLLSGASPILSVACAVLLLALPESRDENLGILGWLGIALVLGVGAWSLLGGMRAAGIMVGAMVVYAMLPLRLDGRWAGGIIVFACVVFLATATTKLAATSWGRDSFVFRFSEDAPHIRQLRAFGDSTPREAVFLVPPSVNARSALRRGVWFSFYDGASFLWKQGAEREVLRRMEVLGIRYVPGGNVNLDSLDSQWYAGLCRSLPMVTGEGVTHVVLPDPSNPEGPWSLHSTGSAMKSLGCPVAEPIILAAVRRDKGP